jgi:hypothetical protein
MLPFTVAELTQAHALLGEDEQEARDFWSAAIADVAAVRDSGADTWGISLADGTLLALSLLSEEMEQRVDRFRRAGWDHRLPVWKRLLSADELQRRIEEHERSEREWHQAREGLRRHLSGGPPA